MRKSKMLIVLIGLLICTTIVLSGCKKEVVPETDYNYGVGFSVAPTNDFVTKNRVQQLDLSIVNGADAKIAAIHLYNVAQANNDATPYLATRSDGAGDAETSVGLITVGGEMRAKSHYVRYGKDWFTQSAGVVMKGKPESCLSIGRMLLNYNNRSGYISATNTFYKESGGSKGNANFDEATGKSIGLFTEKGSTHKKFTNNEALYNKVSAVRTNCYERSNHVISTESIKDAVITDKDTYFEATFSINVEVEEYVIIGRDDLRKSAKSDDLKYVKLDYTIQVWKSGYFRTMSSDESWNATLNLGIKANGTSLSNSKTEFSYVEADCIIGDQLDWITANQDLFEEAVDE